MPYKEYLTEKVYFTISEVAEMIGRDTSCLRYWESEFYWFNPKKNKKGTRHYTRDNIEKALKINLLLSGMTVKGLISAYDSGMEQPLVDIFSTIRRSTIEGKRKYPLNLDEIYGVEI